MNPITINGKPLESLFKYYDRDKDGYLNYSELENLCRDYDLMCFDFHFHYIDQDGDGLISLKDFETWWHSENKFKIFECDIIDLMSHAYATYKAGLDKYSPFNFKNFSQFIYDTYKRGISKDWFQSLDLNGDGSISFYEFCKWLNWF